MHHCPHCWQEITIFDEEEIKGSQGVLELTQDCDRCCHPLVIIVRNGVVEEVRGELR